MIHINESLNMQVVDNNTEIPRAKFQVKRVYDKLSKKNSQREDIDMEEQLETVKYDKFRKFAYYMEDLSEGAKISPLEKKHILYLLVIEARRWRFKTYGDKIQKKEKIFDVREKKNFTDLLNDIDIMMLSKDTIESNDKKDLYNRILINTRDLGLFRPQ
jgi:hypothetical protein